MSKLEDAMLSIWNLTHIDKIAFPEKRFHVTAMAVDSKYNPIASAWNSYSKTHPIQARCAKMCNRDFKVFLHAEIAALVRCRRHDPHSMIVCRTDFEGHMVNAKPCPICMIALEEAGVKEVWYTSKLGWQWMEISG